MSAVVYDAAVLAAADRNERRAWAEHKARLDFGVIPLVPAPVVAQVSRSPQQAQLRRFLTGCLIVPLGESEAHEAGRLLGIIERLPPGHVAQFLRAQLTRLSARVRAARGDDAGVEAGLKSAAGLFREMQRPFEVAQIQLELFEWLVSQGRGEEPAAKDLASEARQTFEGLEARPWLERADRSAVAAGVG